MNSDAAPAGVAAPPYSAWAPAFAGWPPPARPLGVETEIVGVCSAHARAQFDAFTQRKYVTSPATTRLADGMAVRPTDQSALDTIWKHVSRIVMVTDDEVAAAMRALYDDTHNVVEGGGAAGLAAILQEKDQLGGRCAATVITGGNVDRDVFSEVLRG